MYEGIVLQPHSDTEGNGLHFQAHQTWHCRREPNYIRGVQPISLTFTLRTLMNLSCSGSSKQKPRHCAHGEKRERTRERNDQHTRRGGEETNHRAVVVVGSAATG